MKHLLSFTLILCLLSIPSAAAQSPLELFQRALVQEQAAGNLNEAIQLYERVAKEAGGDRALAARALIRAASCYEKLGNLKATQLYQEVVRTYPEQGEEVTTARQRLAELRRLPPNAVAGNVSSIVGPIFNTYCLNCHTPSRNFGIALGNLSMTDLTQNADAWEKIARRLRAGTMPSPGWARPQKAAIDAAVLAIEAALDRGHAQVMQIASPERITDLELASRMAAFLWNAEPDATLLAVARNGTLKNPTILQQQVRRMLSDTRSERLNKFFTDWLRLDDLDMLGNPATIRPEWSEEFRQNAQRAFDRGKELFPEWNDELRQAMKRETQLFIDYQIRQDRPALELWTANYTFLNERMARYYRILNISGPQYRRVNLDGNERAGLLGQASILAMTSVVNRTSPTLRGKWLFATFLGIPVPPPPPNLDLFKPEGSIRKAIEAHTNAPSCRSCHRIFDPLGFALENFDARGRWRDEDSGDPINGTATLYDGVEFSGPSQLRSALMQYSDAFLANITEQLLGFALRPQGRRRPEAAVYAHEMPAVRAILREAAAADYRWSAIILGIVKSTPFQMKNIVP